MAIGPILREARLRKQLSESQVAELTRMKIQLVQDLENDDFHRMAATIYGKGFIKLYAKCVGLDPKPLIDDYVKSVENDNPSLITHGVDNPTVKPILNTQNAAEIEPEVDEEEEIEVEPEEDPDDSDDLFVYTKNKNTIVDDSVKIEYEDPQTSENEKPAITDTIKQWSSNTTTIIRKQSQIISNRIAEVQLGDAPLKIISYLIGAIVMLLIITIAFKSCSRDLTPATNYHAPKSLKTSVPPPEPYFD